MLSAILTSLGWLLAASLVGYFVYALSLPATYLVSRSIVIAKPVPEVFGYVRDFSHWDAWSPWSLHDPNIVIKLDRPSEVGGTYAWESTKVGVGQVRHAAILVNERIDLALNFLKPFKNTASAHWLFQAKDGGTQITWTMQCHAPLPIRPFQAFFAKMIGYDFALGLALLRGQLDPSSEHPTLCFDGVVTRDAQAYATERFVGTLDNMRSTMRVVYPKLWQRITQNKAQGDERAEQKPMIAAYHKVKFLKGTTVMDMGMAVRELQNGEQGMVLPQGNYFQMTMKGNYDFLPFSWNTIYGQMKMRKLKIDKRRPVLEIYQVNPMHAPHSNEWTTLLCVPVRST